VQAYGFAAVPEFDPQRPIADLRELAELTGGEGGARRLAWSDDWAKAREWLLGKIAETGASVERDAAGNLWATKPGESKDWTLMVKRGRDGRDGKDAPELAVVKVN